MFVPAQFSDVVERRCVMTDEKKFHLCEEGRKLYNEWGSIALSWAFPKEVVEDAKRAFLDHFRACPECTKPREEQCQDTLPK